MENVRNDDDDDEECEIVPFQRKQSMPTNCKLYTFTHFPKDIFFLAEVVHRRRNGYSPIG